MNYLNLRVLTDMLGFTVNISIMIGKALASLALAYFLYEAGSLLSKANAVAGVLTVADGATATIRQLKDVK